MIYFPDHLDRTEARIISRLITAILTQSPVSLFVRVHDGEEWATDWTRDRRTISEAVAATEETRFALAETETAEGGAMHRFGSIWLIHGNGEDVISDASFSIKRENAEAIIDALIDHANR